MFICSSDGVKTIGVLGSCGGIRPPTLEPMNSDGETCCQHTSKNSNNYPKTRSYPDYAPKQVPSSNPRTFRKYNQSCIARQCMVTEIFELCETSSKQPCPDCNLYWEAGIVLIPTSQQELREFDTQNIGF